MGWLKIWWIWKTIFSKNYFVWQFLPKFKRNRINYLASLSLLESHYFYEVFLCYAYEIFSYFIQMKNNSFKLLTKKKKPGMIWSHLDLDNKRKCFLFCVTTKESISKKKKRSTMDGQMNHYFFSVLAITKNVTKKIIEFYLYFK